jgi:hypothetical protein
VGHVGLVDVVVDAEHDGGIDVIAGRGDHDLAGAGGEVGKSGVAGAEPPGRLDHDVHAELSPGEPSRVGFVVRGRDGGRDRYLVLGSGARSRLMSRAGAAG